MNCMKMSMFNEQNMLKDGYTANRATYLVPVMQNEKKLNLYDTEYTNWAHSHGFSVKHASYIQLSEDNLSDYLSDYDYGLCFPLNDWTRIWVNDKLTLKLTLHGCQYDHLMPAYYYYATSRGLRSLFDNPYGQTVDDFIMVLKKFGAFACKPNNGAGSQGFFKLSYEDECFKINDEKVSATQIIDFVESHPNYLYTEFINPSAFFHQFSPLIHTMRVNVLNIHGDAPVIIGSWFRLSSSKGGVQNNVACKAEEDYNVIVWIDPETGKYQKSCRAYANRIVPEDIHPETGCSICFDFVEEWKALKEDIYGVCKLFNTLEWLGFDIGITDNGPKIMEINTQGGIFYDQVVRPWMKDSLIGTYFREKLAAIHALSPEQKAARSKILR